MELPLRLVVSAIFLRSHTRNLKENFLFISSLYYNILNIGNDFLASFNSLEEFRKIRASVCLFAFMLYNKYKRNIKKEELDAYAEISMEI